MENPDYIATVASQVVGQALDRLSQQVDRLTQEVTALKDRVATLEALADPTITPLGAGEPPPWLKALWDGQAPPICPNCGQVDCPANARQDVAYCPVPGPS